MKINGKLWISIIFSLFFAVLVLYNIDFGKTSEALATANYIYHSISNSVKYNNQYYSYLPVEFYN